MRTETRSFSLHCCDLGPQVGLRPKIGQQSLEAAAILKEVDELGRRRSDNRRAKELKLQVLAKRIRLVLGIVFPGLVSAVLLLGGLIHAVRFDNWGIFGSVVAMAGLLLGPFVIYYFVCRSPQFSLAIGALLVAASVYSVAEMMLNMKDGSSTAGLSLLWLPMVGYPLVGIGGLLDRLTR